MSKAVDVKTSRFGEIHVDAEKVIRMPLGMFGFSDQKRFVIISLREDVPFYWYQSLDDGELAFPIANPFFFKPDYRVDLEDAAQALVLNDRPEVRDFEIYVVITIPHGAPKQATANLRGPIVLHNPTRRAVQLAVIGNGYSHRFPLMEV